jgi:hypothetical protein
MSNYVKAVDFESKDSLVSGNPLKIIKGVEINDEFNAIQTAVATKADLASPNFLGNPTAVTQSTSDNSTRLATTAFVQTIAGSLGTISTQDSDAVAITGGTITGITDLAVADGGTGSSTLATNAVLLGNGTSALQTVAPGTSGNVLTSDGTTWQSSASNSIGVGQTWQDVTSSRVVNTDYTNSTGKPIMVMTTGYQVASSGPTTFYVGGLAIGYTDAVGTNDVGNYTTTTFIVPNGVVYKITGNTPSIWAELR